MKVRYSTALRPAAPLVPLWVAHPGAVELGRVESAQLDTGADRTVIPLALVSALGLRYIDELEAVVAGGAVVAFPIHEVFLRIHAVMDFVLEVAVHPDEPRVLLGRDVLNALYANLNGPTRILELSAQAITPLPGP